MRQSFTAVGGVMLFQRNFACCAVFLALLLVTGCSRNPLKFMESGKKYLAQHEYQEAIIQLRNAVQLNPRLAEAHYLLGIAYASIGQLQNAAPEFREAVKLQPDSVPIQMKYGNL